MHKKRFFVLGCALAASFASVLHAQDAQFLGGLLGKDVYVMSNNIQANSVAILRHNFFGGLQKVAEAGTGGLGVGVGTTAPAPDPLGAQNALLRSSDGRYLFAVNAGSDQVSVLRIAENGLELVDLVPSGGTYPVSLAQRGHRLYVLNSGGASLVSVFEISRSGTLAAVPKARRLIGTDAPLVGNQPNVGMTPAQIQFDPAGRWLTITVKNAESKGFIETFAADQDGNLASNPVITPSADTTPFGFTFDRAGALIVAEAGGAAVSSYRIENDGDLKTLSASVPNHQAATCWLTANQQFAYVANAGSSTLSGYRIGPGGRLSLLEADGVTARLPAGHAPTDIKLSADGRALYVLSPGAGTISSYFVSDGGDLFPLGETAVFPALSGMQGLSVK